MAHITEWSSCAHLGTPAPTRAGSIRGGYLPPVPAVVVNGDSREVEVGTTVLGLLQALGLDARQVAVERNREIVPRAQHGETTLEDGDKLEVVTFVGGG